ncbi:MAG: PAS domain S-box protein [Bacteroidales bacterium]|nr:PAS domain S-box protein [Bacteroidales bacterium]MCF8456543.1 PAS domain S-box protein [Bacteroidales bacterium]
MQQLNTSFDLPMQAQQVNYSDLFDHLDDAIILCDLHARITYLNAPASRILGKSKAFLSNKSIDQIIQSFDFDVFKSFAADEESLEYMFLHELPSSNSHPSLFELKFKKIPTGINPPVFALFIKSVVRVAKSTYNSSEEKFQFEELTERISNKFIHTDLHSIDDTIQDTLELLGKYSKADRSSFFLFSGDLQYINLLHQWVRDGSFPKGKIGSPIEVGKVAWLKEHFSRDLPIVLNDIESLPLSAAGEWELINNSGIISIVCVPIRMQGQLLGFISCQSNTDYITWDNTAIRLLKVTGEIIVSALKREGYNKLKSLKDIQFHTIFDNAVFGLYRTTPEGEVIMANNALLRMTGYSKIDELKKINLDQDGYFNNFTRKRFKYQMNRYGEVNLYKSIWKRKDGKPLYVIENSKAVKDSHGKILYYEGSIEDITVKTQNEEDSFRLSQVIEQAAVSIIITDTSGKIKFANPFFEKISGYTIPEVIGKNPSILQSGLHCNEFYKDLWGTILSGKVWEGVFTNKNKNGELYEESAIIFPIYNKDGKLINFAAVKQDIGEQLRYQKIENLLYKISNAVYETRDLSELYLQIRKYLSEVINTKNFFIAIYDEKEGIFNLPYDTDEMDIMQSFPAAHSLSMYLMNQDKAMIFKENDIDKLIVDDSIRLIGTKSKVWLGVPLRTNGKPIGVIGLQSYDSEVAYSKKDLELLEFVSDQIKLSIERKETELNLKEAKKKAEQSDKLKSSFLSNMSHEIRTPMNAIIGFSTLLANESISTVDRTNYNLWLQEGVKTLLNLIEDIIDMSKIEAGETQINKRPINLVKEMRELQKIHSILKQKASKHQIDFRLNIDPELKSESIFTDPLRLRQILTNLLSNAIKYSHKGCVEFGYKKKGGFIQFYVKDTGIGIPANKIQYIFNTFTKFSETKTKVYGGTGIGLAISKKLVELLGGTMWAESQVDVGSTFYFTIPDEKLPIPSITSLGEETKNGESLQLAGRKILVAEDVESNFILMDLMLKPTGATIMWAKDGKEAVDIVAQNPDLELILMDVRMPVMNGFEATRKLRELNCKIPIIAQTAHAFEQDKAEALKSGCEDFIAKPINPTSLINKISRHLVN